jgi:hypothetical protein
MTPDKIYIFQDDGDRYWYKPKEWETPPLTRVEYIRKDALLEWAKKELESAEFTNFDEFGRGEVITWNHVLDKLNSM